MGAAPAWESETPADPFAAARARFEQLLRVAGSEETQRMQHSDLERLLAEQGQQLMRELYQNCVDQQAQAEVTDEVVDAAGKQRTRKRPQQRELETIFGTVEVQRTGYGAEGAASLHPLDAQLNLPDERYSLEVRRRVALEAISFTDRAHFRFTREYSTNADRPWISTMRRLRSFPLASATCRSSPRLNSMGWVFPPLTAKLKVYK